MINFKIARVRKKTKGETITIQNRLQNLILIQTSLLKMNITNLKVKLYNKSLVLIL